MYKYVLILILALAFSTTVRAEEAQPIRPSSQDQSSQTLGPSSSGDSAGPSISGSQLLQPSSPSTLQALQSADAISGGIPQPTSNSDLQSAGGQPQFKDFAGIDANTAAQHGVDKLSGNHNLVWLVVLLALAALAFIMPSNRNPFKATATSTKTESTDLAAKISPQNKPDPESEIDSETKIKTDSELDSESKSGDTSGSVEK